jgi:hypothetical protein
MTSRNEFFLLFQILTPRHYQYHKYYNFGVNNVLKKIPSQQLFGQNSQERPKMQKGANVRG